MDIYVVLDSEHQLVNIFPTREAAEKDDGCTIEKMRSSRESWGEAFVVVTTFVRCARCSNDPWFVVGPAPVDHWDSEYCGRHRDDARVEQATDAYLGQYVKRMHEKGQKWQKTVNT